MLHNSLFRREFLRKMNHHPLVVARRDVHRNVARRPDAKPRANQVELSGDWAIRCVGNHISETAVANDAADFLRRLGVTRSAAAANEIRLRVGSMNRGFRCLIGANRIELDAANAAALWAGWVHLENQMRTNGGPILEIGELERTPAWPIQIAPPTWGANYAVPDCSPDFLGDDTFRSLAHGGADGLFVYGDFLLYAADTRFPELNHPVAAKNIATLRDAAERAAAYGIQIYFCPVSPKLPENHELFKRRPDVRGAKLAHSTTTSLPPIHCLCSSSPDALGFHADVMGRLFRDVPALGGLILIVGGESYYHCFMRSAGSRIGHTNCPHCNGKVPEDVIANLLRVTADAVHAAKPNATIMAWPYSAQYFWSDEPNQLKLIDRLPPDVSLLSEIDKDQTIQRGGYAKRIWDYTVDFDGASDRIRAQAQRAAQIGRDLFVKTETSHGIELLHLPYVPAIGRSARQWNSVRDLRPRGVLQRWGFIGMFDSVAERIGYEARWNPHFSPDVATMDVARQLFADAASIIVQAWKHFDDSVHHIPLLTTDMYYIGPAFLGPCHPLPTWLPDGPVPDAFNGSLFYLLESEPTMADAPLRAKDDLTLTSTKQLILFGDEPPPTVIESEFSTACHHARRGHELLQKIPLAEFPKEVRDEIIEQQTIGEYLYRTYFTTVSTLQFIQSMQQHADRATLIAIARRELDNTRSARKIYETAPWLSHDLRLDMNANPSLTIIDEKIRLLQNYLA